MSRANERDFLATIQHHVARLSVGASAARGQGVPDVVRKARSYLAADLPLRRFGVRGARSFNAALDRETVRLQRVLPRGAQSWGMARKLLNIFLRNALYTGYLREAYHLDAAKELYEVPLDSIVAKELRRGVGRGELPRWPGVKYLRREVSDQYQAEALRRAGELGTERVHLDAYWWGGPRTPAA